MVACELPLVAAAVGDAALLLKNHPACLYEAGDAEGLSRRLEQQLQSPVPVPPSLALSWDALAIKLEGVLQKAIRLQSDSQID